MNRQRIYNGIILGLAFLLLCNGIRGYYPRYEGLLQEERPFALPEFSEGHCQLLIINNKGTGNPSETLKQPPAPCIRTLFSGLAAASLLSLAREEVKIVVSRGFAGSLHIATPPTDLIYPFHYFL